MDKAKILRLLDEADDIVNALYRQGANKDYKCKSLREKLKAIATEISEPNHAYWIPTDCGVKCSECGTEYADMYHPEKMYQCPHCYSQMGEPLESEAQDNAKR